MQNLKVKQRGSDKPVCLVDANLFTTRLDKNGTEIYENDLVILGGMIDAKVIWQDCGFKLQVLDDDELTGRFYDLGYWQDVEVISTDVWEGSK